MTKDNKIKEKTPFIKKFKDGEIFYIYDVNTNQVVEVEQPVYDLIDYFNGEKFLADDLMYNSAFKEQEIKPYMQQIKQAHDNDGLFSNFRPSLVGFGIVENRDVKKLHSDYGLNQIILELTRECNLNCSYCNTSGKYYSSLENTSFQMDWQQCKKAVDFFCEHAADKIQTTISFYGGEPLLRFDLIKQTVEYVRERYKEKNPRFSMTTNGTLLDLEKIEYMIENNFSLSISLDGPESVNDRYRQFKDGSGTFTTIMRNLSTIKKIDPEYFSNRVRISSVLAPPFDQIDDILDFFSNNEVLKEIKSSIRSSSVNTDNTNFLEDYHIETDEMIFAEVAKKMTTRLKNAILKKELSEITIEKMNLFSILKNIVLRPIKKLDDYSYPLGACHIGLRRLFITVSGDFYICERSGNDYKIGNLEKGLDYCRITEYYTKFEKAVHDCKNCWALNYCERCWIVVGNLDEFIGEKKEKFCHYNKTIIENAFKLYVQLLKENPDCMSVFQKDVLGNDTNN